MAGHVWELATSHDSYCWHANDRFWGGWFVAGKFDGGSLATA